MGIMTTIKKAAPPSKGAESQTPKTRVWAQKYYEYATHEPQRESARIQKLYDQEQQALYNSMYNPAQSGGVAADDMWSTPASLKAGYTDEMYNKALKTLDDKYGKTVTGYSNAGGDTAEFTQQPNISWEKSPLWQKPQDAETFYKGLYGNDIFDKLRSGEAYYDSKVKEHNERNWTDTVLGPVIRGVIAGTIGWATGGVASPLLGGAAAGASNASMNKQNVAQGALVGAAGAGLGSAVSSGVGSATGSSVAGQAAGGAATNSAQQLITTGKWNPQQAGIAGLSSGIAAAGRPLGSNPVYQGAYGAATGAGMAALRGQNVGLGAAQGGASGVAGNMTDSKYINQLMSAGAKYGVNEMYGQNQPQQRSSAPVMGPVAVNYQRPTQQIAPQKTMPNTGYIQQPMMSYMPRPAQSLANAAPMAYSNFNRPQATLVRR